MKTQAEQRAELAYVVAGIPATVGDTTVTTTGHLTPPKTPQAYDAWPVWVATRPTTMCIAETDWQIVLALPGSDPQTWCLMGDALITELMAALAPYDVPRVEPVQILLAEGQSMPGIAFSVTV